MGGQKFETQESQGLRKEKPPSAFHRSWWLPSLLPSGCSALCFLGTACSYVCVFVISSPPETLSYWDACHWIVPKEHNAGSPCFMSLNLILFAKSPFSQRRAISQFHQGFDVHRLLGVYFGAHHCVVTKRGIQVWNIRSAQYLCAYTYIKHLQSWLSDTVQKSQFFQALIATHVYWG